MSCTICPKTKDYCLDPECGLTTGICNPSKVAILKESTPSTESQEEQKGDLQETQEAMWNYVDFLINDPALPPRSWNQKRKQLTTEFTITRKP